MEPYLYLLSQTPLFAEVSTEEITQMLNCLDAKKKLFHKGGQLFRVGDTTREFGVVLSGSVLLVKEDVWGRRNILGKMKPGEFFAEPFAASNNVPLNINIVADEESEVLLIDVTHILTSCPTPCACHERVIRNMISVLAKKTLDFNEKIEHMGKKTTREKLLSYLSSESQRQDSLEFDIPYDRQELADYLCVERAAMSTALSKIKDEGLIDYKKNHFILRNAIEAL